MGGYTIIGYFCLCLANREYRPHIICFTELKIQILYPNVEGSKQGSRKWNQKENWAKDIART